jgi:hypothetical protein
MKKNNNIHINFTLPLYLLEFFEDQAKKINIMAPTSHQRNKIMVGVLEDYYEAITTSEGE